MENEEVMIVREEEVVAAKRKKTMHQNQLTGHMPEGR
jgi:hypothetical protein